MTHEYIGVGLCTYCSHSIVLCLQIVCFRWLLRKFFTDLIPSTFGMLVYNDFTSSDTTWKLSGTNSTVFIFHKKSLVSLTKNGFLSQWVAGESEHIFWYFRCVATYNESFFFFNWDTQHARLNSYYEAWSYKKKKHKKDHRIQKICLERTYS